MSRADNIQEIRKTANFSVQFEGSQASPFSCYTMVTRVKGGRGDDSLWELTAGAEKSSIGDLSALL